MLIRDGRPVAALVPIEDEGATLTQAAHLRRAPNGATGYGIRTGATHPAAVPV